MKVLTLLVPNGAARLLSKVFDGEQFDVQSPLPCAQALAQLQMLTEWRSDKSSLMGSVNTDTIELRIPHVFMRGNGTRFRGRLLTSDEGSLLVGSFISSAYSRFITAIVLVMVGVMLFGGLLGGLYQAVAQASSLLNALTVIGFLLVWGAGVCLMGWLVVWNGAPARKDVLVISTAIRHALQERRT
ncbi:hypothetical protein [Pandoraea sp. NPDC090278]|uniref:hypothetical protein n=1 Tax=Pandoraea sp. NPDC090278 TaxID=3364391 RepID=UPI00383AEFFD